MGDFFSTCVLSFLFLQSLHVGHVTIHSNLYLRNGWTHVIWTHKGQDLLSPLVQLFPHEPRVPFLSPQNPPKYNRLFPLLRLPLPNTSLKFLLRNAVVTCEIKLFQNYFSIRWCPSKNFISACWNLPEIISTIFHRFIAAHEYFPTC